MASNFSMPPRALTLIELLLSYGLFCGGGYFLAGTIGALCGAGLVTIRYGYLVWQAAHAPGP